MVGGKGLGFGDSGVRFSISERESLRFRVKGSGFIVQSSGFRVQDSGLRAEG